MPHVEIDIAILRENRPFRLEHEGTGIVLVLRQGEVFAFHDTCPHAGWRLSDGEFADGLLECPGHGWRFDPATGQCVDVPDHCMRLISTRRVGEKVRLEWLEEADSRPQIPELSVKPRGA